MALDYDWDHNNTGYSKSSCSTCGPTPDLNSKTQGFFLLFFRKKNSGMVYFTVSSEGSSAGAIKRAYIPSVDDGSNNVGASVPLDVDYITSPAGIAVDWVGRCVSDTQLSPLARLCSFWSLASHLLHIVRSIYCTGYSFFLFLSYFPLQKSILGRLQIAEVGGCLVGRTLQEAPCQNGPGTSLRRGSQPTTRVR